MTDAPVVGVDGTVVADDEDNVAAVEIFKDVSSTPAVVALFGDASL